MMYLARYLGNQNTKKYHTGSMKTFESVKNSTNRVGSSCQAGTGACAFRPTLFGTRIGQPPTRQPQEAEHAHDDKGALPAPAAAPARR